MASEPDFASFIAQPPDSGNFLTYYEQYPTDPQTQALGQSVENSASANPFQQLDWDFQDLKNFKSKIELDFKDFTAMMRRLELDIEALKTKVEDQAKLLARTKTHQQQTTTYLSQFRTEVLNAVQVLGPKGQKDMISPPVWERERELRPAPPVDSN